MHLLANLILFVGMSVAAAASSSVTACTAGFLQSLPNVPDRNHHRDCRNGDHNKINSGHRVRLSFFLQSRIDKHPPLTSRDND